jgi:hypothetical protein
MIDRKHFLITMIRGGIFASLAMITGLFIHRWSLASGCHQNFACGNCTLSGRCQLPEADNYRLDKARFHKTNLNNGKS